MPGDLQKELQQILNKPVPTGSTKRFKEVVNLFDRARVSDPTQAQSLQRRLNQKSHPLRKLMDSRLSRSRVPKIVARLGVYPDTQSKRGTTVVSRSARAAPSTPAETPREALGTDEDKIFQALKRPKPTSSRSWPPPGLENLQFSKRPIRQRYFDRGTDDSDGPLRLSESGKVVSEKWIRAYARKQARGGISSRDIIKSFTGSRLFDGDATAATRLVRQDAEALDAAADHHDRLSKEALERSAPSGGWYLNREQANLIRKQKKYDRPIPLDNIGGFGTGGFFRVGQTVHNRKVIQYDPNGSMGGTVYFEANGRVYGQVKNEFEKGASAREIVAVEVYDRTKHVPRAITAVERKAGQALAFSRAPGLQVLGEGLIYHADMGDEEQDRAEGRPGTQQEPSYDPQSGQPPPGGVPARFGKRGRRRKVVPQRRLSGATAAGSEVLQLGRLYQEGSYLMSHTGDLTDNGIAYLRNNATHKMRKKIRSLSDTEIRRAWRGDRVGIRNAPGSGDMLEQVVKEEARVAWLTQTSKRSFMLSNSGQTLESVAKEIWKADKRQRRNASIFSKPLAKYIESKPALKREFQRLAKHPKKEIRQGIEDMYLQKVGQLKPDIVEVLLDRGTAVVTDVTTNRELAALHRFKTSIYKSVFRDTTKLDIGAKDFRSLLETTLIPN